MPHATGQHVIHRRKPTNQVELLKNQSNVTSGKTQFLPTKRRHITPQHPNYACIWRH